MEDNTNVNAAILERLEKVVESLQDNSVKMGQLLAVHNEKLDKQDRIDAVLFEKIEQVDQHIWRYANAAGIDNKDHWIEPHLPDLDRDISDEVGIDFD